MPSKSDDLLRSALSLAESERADLAASLIRSLDSAHDPNTNAAWAAEITRRIESIDNGDTKLISWDAFVDKMRVKNTPA